MADVVVNIRGNSDQLSGDFRKAQRIVDVEATRLGEKVGGAGIQIKKLPDALEKFGSSFRQVSSVGGAAFSGAAGQVKNLAEAFLVGGVAGVGLAAAFQAVGYAAEQWQKFKAAEAQLSQLSVKFGVTREAVDDLERSLTRAGASVDRLASQDIIRLGLEAGLTVSEVRGLSGEIANLAAMDGIDPTAAAGKLFKEIGRNVDAVTAKINAALRARYELEKPSAEVSEGRATVGNLEHARAKLLADLDAAEKERKQAEAQLADTKKRVEAGQGWLVSSLNQQERDLPAYSKRVEQVTLDLADNERQILRLTEATDMLSDAERREIQIKEEQTKAVKVYSDALAGMRLQADAARISEDERGAAAAELRAKLTELNGQLSDRKITEPNHMQATMNAYNEYARKLREIAAREADLALKRKEFAHATEAIKLDVVGDAERKRVLEYTAEIERLRALLAKPLKMGGITQDEFTSRQTALDMQLQADLATIHEGKKLAALKWAAESAAIQARISRDEREQLRLRASAEIEALNTRANIMEHGESALAERRKLIRAQLTADLAEIDRKEQRAAQDYAAQTAAMMADATGKRMDAIRLANAAEVEQVRRAEQDKLISHENAAARRVALELQLNNQIAEARTQELSQAAQFGAGMGQAIIDGMNEAASGDPAKAMIRTWFKLFSSILSFIPGAQPFGQLFSMFAGAFAEGGLVGGARTSGRDNKVVSVRGGEFVNDPLTTGRFGAGFFDQLKDGVVDLAAARRAGAKVLGAGALRSSGSTAVTFTQENNFNGTLYQRDLLIREFAGVFRQMAIDNVSTVIRQLGLDPHKVSARG